MRTLIPAVVIAVVAEVVEEAETHATIDSLLAYAGAPGDPPQVAKRAKVMEWLRRTNLDEATQPLLVLGKVLEGYMEATIDPSNEWGQRREERKEVLTRVLAENHLQYVKGGRVVGALVSPSESLEQYIRQRDIPAMNHEFDRALLNAETNPRDGVSAASNLLESVCKLYIEEEELEMPPKQDLRSVWAMVRKGLGLDPSRIEERDIQEILTGMGAVVSGLSALRTHASSAHGAGKKPYSLEPRHARLSIHSAHTLALFILETWEKRRSPG